MKSDNYFVIFGWMTNELGLSGNELLIYSIIYGFTQDGETKYKGGRGYLAKTLNITKPTVDKALSGLIEKGYITKTVIMINNVTFHEYAAALPVVKNLYGGGKESLQGSKETLSGGGKESLPSNNNIEIKDRNIKGNINKDISDILNAVDLIRNNEKLTVAFVDFIDMRKSIKHPITTERAMKMIINRTFQLAGGDPEKMIDILNQSIRNNWRDVYALKTGAEIPPKCAGEFNNPFSKMLNEEGYK